MSDPTGGSITLSHGIAVGIGGAAVAIGRAVWGALTKSRSETIAVLQAENDRLRSERDALGKEKDALQEEKLRMVGIIIAQRASGGADFDELPTGIKNLADLMDPKASRKALDPHPELKDWDPTLSTPPNLRLPRIKGK